MSQAAPFQPPFVQLRSASQNPLIFQRMVRGADPTARPGDVVSVYDKEGRYFGRGLYNPRSQIALRMLTWSDLAIDRAFWRQKLADAVELRRRLQLEAVTDAFRLIHAEGDGLSGLIAERYADTLVFEVFSLGMFQRIDTVASNLSELLGPPSRLDRPDKVSPAWRVVVRADERVQQIEGFRVPNPADADTPAVVIREHGIRFRVDVTAGHKTGFFCDQRDNRRKLATLCRDARILDIGCYTGGFSLYAKLLGQAAEVTAVDLDEKAIVVARDNANLNQTRIDFVHADGFAYLRQMIANRRTFDTVVLDPPKFAPTRGDYEEALSKYYDLNCLGVQCVRPGGVLLTCSCSGLVSPDTFVDTLHRAVRRCGRQCQIFEQTGAGPDHPVMLNCPESAYLKAVWCRMF